MMVAITELTTMHLKVLCHSTARIKLIYSRRPQKFVEILKLLSNVKQSFFKFLWPSQPIRYQII